MANYDEFMLSESCAYDDPADLLDRAEQLAIEEWEANCDRPAYQECGLQTYVKNRVRIMFERGELS